LSSLYWLGLAAGFILAILVALVAPLVALFFAEPKLTNLIRLAGLSFLIAPIGLQFQLLFQKNLDFRPMALVEIPSSMAGVIVAALSALNGLGVISIVLGSLVTAIVKAVAFLWVGNRRWPLSLECSPSEVKELLSFGAFQVGERTVNFCARNLDKALIGWLLGAASLGIYNTAYQLMQKPLQLVQPLTTRIATPLFVHVRGDKRRIASAYLLVVELSAIVLFPVFALMGLLANPLVDILLGPGWLPLVPVFQCLCVLGCFYAIGFPIGSLLMACRRADLSFWLNVWGLVPFALAFALGYRFGLVGIAIALVVAQALGLFSVGFWLRQKLVGMSATQFLGAISAPFLIVTTSSALLAVFLAIAKPRGDMDQLALGTLLFLVVYAGLLLTFRRSFLVKVWHHLTGMDASSPARLPPESAA
jgi:O-antigen/teichoic acid export membrane protein